MYYCPKNSQTSGSTVPENETMTCPYSEIHEYVNEGMMQALIFEKITIQIGFGLDNVTFIPNRFLCS